MDVPNLVNIYIINTRKNPNLEWQEEKDDERYDSRSDDSIEKPSGDSYLASGKGKLRAAQRDLNKALEEWNQALS